MRPLTSLFNKVSQASPYLYAANEAAQALHMKAVFSVYNHMPFGGAFTQNYASGFFGAVAGVLALKTATQRWGGPSLKAHGAKVALGATGLMLGAYELWQARAGRLDWGDMAVYAVALSLAGLLGDAPAGQRADGRAGGKAEKNGAPGRPGR